MEPLYLLGAGLAIGLAGLGVGIWEGMVAKKSLESMGKNPEMSGYFLVLTILGIALVESAAIYGLIIAWIRCWYWWMNARIWSYGCDT